VQPSRCQWRYTLKVRIAGCGLALAMATSVQRSLKYRPLTSVITLMGDRRGRLGAVNLGPQNDDDRRGQRVFNRTEKKAGED